jgi:hypothetical protein
MILICQLIFFVMCFPSPMPEAHKRNRHRHSSERYGEYGGRREGYGYGSGNFSLLYDMDY